MDVIRRRGVLPRRVITIGVSCISSEKRVFLKEVGMGDFPRHLAT